jgi:hypothetical protein
MLSTKKGISKQTTKQTENMNTRNINVVIPEHIPEHHNIGFYRILLKNNNMKDIDISLTRLYK